MRYIPFWLTMPMKMIGGVFAMVLALFLIPGVIMPLVNNTVDVIGETSLRTATHSRTITLLDSEVGLVTARLKTVNQAIAEAEGSNIREASKWHWWCGVSGVVGAAEVCNMVAGLGFNATADSLRGEREKLMQEHQRLVSEIDRLKRS